MGCHQEYNDDSSHLDHMIIDHSNFQRFRRLARPPIGKAKQAKPKAGNRKRRSKPQLKSSRGT